MTRRRLFVGLSVLAAVAAIAGAWYLEAGRYERNFMGKPEAEAVAVLGEASEDTRRRFAGRDHDVLIWHTLTGRYLALIIKDGIVVRQSYGSK